MATYDFLLGLHVVFYVTLSQLEQQKHNPNNNKSSK